MATLPKPLVGAATTYFVVNTLAIATAIALSTNQAIFKIWNENFLWSAPSYFVGAGAAALATWMVNSWSAHWITPLAVAPLYLTYRTYKVYLGRIEDEQRHVHEMADLHLATIEALALAIDAKDQTSQSHIRRVQLYAASRRASARHVGQRRAGREDGGAPARHRQARRAGAHPVEARAADARRVPEDSRPSQGRRGHRQLGAVPLPRGPAHPEPPRTVGRQGLPDRAEG